MSASTAGALKAYIEAAGLGITVFRDLPAQGIPRPYVVIHENIALVPTGTEDGVAGAVTETAQVSLFMTRRDPTTGKVAESYTLAPALLRLLHGCSVLTTPTRCYGVLVRNQVRLLEPDENIVHVAFTVELKRTA